MTTRKGESVFENKVLIWNSLKDKNMITSEKLQKFEKELDYSDTKRADIKRVLMRFSKDQMIGFRLELQ